MYFLKIILNEEYNMDNRQKEIDNLAPYKINFSENFSVEFSVSNNLEDRK